MSLPDLPLYERPDLKPLVEEIAERFPSATPGHRTRYHVLPPGIDHDRLGNSTDGIFVTYLAATGLPPAHRWLEEGDTGCLWDLTDEQARATDAWGNTLLHRAVLHPDGATALPMMRALLNGPFPGTLLDQPNDDGLTPMDLVRQRIDGEPGVYWAALLGTLLQQHLPEPGAPVVVPFESDEDAATPVDEDLVAQALQFGLHGTVRTLLREAPWYRDLVLWNDARTPATVDLLVELGFDVNDAGDALHDALIFNRSEALIGHLVALGAPLPHAALNTAMPHTGAEALVPILMKAGADPQDTDRDGRNALFLAVVNGRLPLVQTLLELPEAHALMDGVVAHPMWFQLQNPDSPATAACAAEVSATLRRTLHQAMDEVDARPAPDRPSVTRARL